DNLVHRTDEFLHVRDGTVECLLFLGGELNLDHPLNPSGTDHHRNSSEQPLDTVLALQIRGTRHQLFLVSHVCFDHHEDRGPLRVVGRCFHQIHDFAAPVAGADFDLIQAPGRNEAFDRYAADGGVATDWHHIIAVSAQHHRVDALDRDPEFHTQESAITRGVEHAGLADDLMFGESGYAF